MALKAPTRKLSMFTSFIMSDKVITAGVAIVSTPFVTSLANRLSSRFGQIPGGPTGALIVVAFVLFVIAGMFSGIIGNIVLGLAASAFISAIVTIPRVSGIIGSFNARATRSG